MQVSTAEVVEQGPSLRVIREPTDAYTKRLRDAIPNPFAERSPAGEPAGPWGRQAVVEK